MKSTFNITRVSRQVYDRFFGYTTEQLNTIPPGFSNNLIWNIGHIVVSQQMLMYLASGNTPNVSAEMIDRYKRGSRPDRDAKAEEIAEIRNLLFTLVDKSEEDYNAGLFTTYTERKTELGFTLSTIEDAIAFNNYHEGTHLGIMMSLRKFV